MVTGICDQYNQMHSSETQIEEIGTKLFIFEM